MQTGIGRHLRHLTKRIGVRLAGSDNERQAAKYIADALRRAGAVVTVDTFPVQERAVKSETLEIKIDGRWQRIPCSLLSNAPGTDGNWVQKPLVFLDARTGYQRSDLSCLTGKAVLHFGTHIETIDHYRRLMAAKPAFLLFVDVRYPGTVVTADGMFPSYVRKYGAVPAVSIAYMTAWDFMAAGAGTARLRVDGGMRASTSQNVVGELPGSDPGAGLIVIGAHHDTQAGSVGADDNATGVAALIELARHLAGVKRKKTIRLISFGAEEQLSVGSAAYVRRHRSNLAAGGGLMVNFDSFGSRLGWTILECGNLRCATLFAGHLKKRDIYVRQSRDTSPYCDSFPFAAAGLLTVSIGRNNCLAGRFFHHRPDDDLSRVSCGLVARTAAAAGDALADLAAVDAWPFRPALPPSQRSGVTRLWQDFYGGWR